MENEIVQYQAEAPATTQVVGALTKNAVQELKERRAVVRTYIQQNMHKDVDYGVIPGTGGKPSLWKMGAEKLATLFGLSATFECINQTQDWNKPFFNFVYKCRLMHNGVQVGECDASCNSYEKKYRYRTVNASRATAEEREKAVRTEMRDTRNGRYFIYVIENDDIFSQVNTLQKMAQKRALVGAILNATAAGDFFINGEAEAVQERMDQGDVIDAEARPVDPKSGIVDGEIRICFPKNNVDQDALAQVKAAGFRWDGKAYCWRAPESEERKQIFELLNKEGLLQ